jgi:hypothetical protein
MLKDPIEVQQQLVDDARKGGRNGPFAEKLPGEIRAGNGRKGRTSRTALNDHAPPPSPCAAASIASSRPNLQRAVIPPSTLMIPPVIHLPGDRGSGALRSCLMDALSAVLAPVRLQQTCWAFTVGRAPWGLAFPGGQSCIRFHYVLRGSAWLSVDKTDEPRIALSGGDLAVLPLGHAHVLRDHPRSAPVRVVPPQATKITPTPTNTLRIEFMSFPSSFWSPRPRIPRNSNEPRPRPAEREARHTSHDGGFLAASERREPTRAVGSDQLHAIAMRWTVFSTALAGRHSAVDEDVRARHPIRAIRREQRDDLRHVVRGPEATERD